MKIPVNLLVKLTKFGPFGVPSGPWGTRPMKTAAYEDLAQGPRPMAHLQLTRAAHLQLTRAAHRGVGPRPKGPWPPLAGGGENTLARGSQGVDSLTWGVPLGSPPRCPPYSRGPLEVLVGLSWPRGNPRGSLVTDVYRFLLVI